MSSAAAPSIPAVAPPASARSIVVAWQGWRIEMPARWSPRKLEGDYDQGYALFADLHRPRMALRWAKVKKSRRSDPAVAIAQAMRHEIGALAAHEAKATKLSAEGFESASLYLEPQPPGRDVWIGYSPVSSRILQVIHHTRHRDTFLADTLLASLLDIDRGKADKSMEKSASHAMMPWSIFELSCVAPAKYSLKSQRLHAGDLSLTLGYRKAELTIRQIAVAKLALTRMPLEKWLVQQENINKNYYRPIGKPQPCTLGAFGGRTIDGLMRTAKLRHRQAWQKWVGRSTREHFAFVLHDELRDRLVLLDGSDRQDLENLAETIGWAQAA